MPEQLRPYRTSKTDTVALSGLLGLTCTVQVATGNFSPALSNVDPVFLYVTIAPLAVGAWLILTGCVWKGSNLAALQWELVGRVFVAVPALVFGGAVVAQAGLAGGVSAAFAFAYGLSSAWRAWKIRGWLNHLHYGLIEMAGGSERGTEP